MFKRIFCALLLGATSGCTLIPDYQRPTSPVAERFPGGSEKSTDIDALPWRDFYADPRLTRCIEIALENNRDLRVAVLKVEKARAQYRIQRAELLPQLDATGSYTRARSQGVTSNQYDAGVGVTSYELDLFGRVRSNNRQVLEEYFSLAETRRSTHISLIAEVATQYLTLREYEEQLALARETLESVSGSLELTQKKIDAGGAARSDLASVEVQVQTAKVNVHTYERLAAQAGNTLAELLGQSVPADLPAGLALDDPRLLPAVASGLSSDLIARRPDILAAEHTLLAANADIGAARAAFFPSITLTGSAGYSSSELTGLFNSSNGVWSFMPQITVPIFSGGSNRATLDAAKISMRIEVANYEKAIQTAFREVADALVASDSYTSQVQAQVALVKAQQDRFDFAQKKYDSGIAGYLDVLSAQQDLFSARQNLISARVAQSENVVTLYKVLGGGWR
jgi:outer membrane protein, multidrug efflux system